MLLLSESKLAELLLDTKKTVIEKNTNKKTDMCISFLEREKPKNKTRLLFKEAKIFS